MTLTQARDITWNMLTEGQVATDELRQPTIELSPLRRRALHFLLCVSESHEVTVQLSVMLRKAILLAKKETVQ